MDAAGKVLVKTKDQVVLAFPIHEVSITEEDQDIVPEAYAPLLAAREEKISDPYEFGDTIDLHYDVLIESFPHLQGSKLEYQLDICTQFIQTAVDTRLNNIQIIHGRGQGILKQEVELLLKTYPEITIISSNPNLASVDAWMNYR